MTTNPAASIAKGHEPYDSKKHGPLSPRALPATRVVEALHKAGFPESEWVTGVAIARRESAFVPELIGAVNPKTRQVDPENSSWDFGLFQISYRWNSHLLDENWDDPDANARIAKHLFDESVRRGYAGWRPWHTYTSGNYKVYLDLAKDAVADYKESETYGAISPTRAEDAVSLKSTTPGRMPGIEWKPLSINFSNGGNNPRVLVIHTIVGSLAGADSWFRNGNSRVSAHFGTSKDGRIIQWVNTHDTAWANVAANRFSVSIENEGHVNEPLTDEQVEACARIYAFVATEHGVPLEYVSSETGSGLGYHSQFSSWSGGGTACPGPKRVAQLGEIMERAAEILGGSAPRVPAPSTGGSTSGGLTSVRSVEYQQDAVNDAGYPTELAEDGLWGPRTDAGVKWLQKKLGVTADGLWGPATDAAHQKSLRGDSQPKENKVTVDGILGSETISELQRALNEGRF